MNKFFRAFATGTVLLAAPLAGCDKRLNIDPVDTVLADKAIQSSADVESLLRGGYAVLGSSDLYGGRLQYIADLLGDPKGANSELFWQGTYAQPNEIYHKSIAKTNTFVSGTWNQAYQAINIANTVLANISKVTPVKQDQITGEAKFIRGIMYFELVRLFAKDWNNGSPTANPGVPLVLTATNIINGLDAAGPAAKISRNTVAEVYAQVLSDLLDAELKLNPSAPGSATTTIFATTYTVSGMLSRVYLQQRKYDLAAIEADKVIKSGLFRLITPISDVFASKGNTNEDVFNMQVNVQSGVNDLNTFYSTYGRGGDISVLPTLSMSYDAADDRGQLFNQNYGTLTTKFDQVYGNVKVMRLAEMYLTRAEGNFRAATHVGAEPFDDLNTVRGRAHAPLLMAADVTLDVLFTDRHQELSFEGFYLHDFKRNGRAVGDLSVKADNLILPIPQSEINVNANLTQNPGYF